MTLSDDQERRVGDLEFRVEQELQQFNLYEQRRLAVELQATAITAAALTIAALLIAGQERLSKLGNIIEYGIAVAIVSLAVAIVCASCARFVSWRSPKWLGRPEPRRDLAVKESLQALRDVTMTTPSCELRVLGLDLWKNRRVSAYELGRFKYKWLFGAVLALVVPVVFLLAVGVALVV